MKHPLLALLTLVLLLLAGCKAPQDIVYYQDTTSFPADSIAKIAWKVASPEKLTLQQGDKLSIVVSSPTTPELASIFNKGLAARSISGVPTSTYNLSPYRLDQAGDVVLPIVGKVNLLGLSRAEAVAKIENLLHTHNHLQDAIVTITLYGQYVSVLGEVKNAGRVDFENDFMTVNEALSRCGDLTIHADRRHIMVLREEGNQVKHYTLDFTQGHQIATSPAYHLQPGDVIYVTPNKHRIRESHAYGNTWQQPYIYFSLISVLTSIVSLIIAL